MLITAPKGLISMTRWFFLVPVLLVLCVCDSSQPVRLAQARVIDQGGNPAALPDYSRQWWTAIKAIEAEEDARLATILIICKGCFD